MCQPSYSRPPLGSDLPFRHGRPFCLPTGTSHQTFPVQSEGGREELTRSLANRTVVTMYKSKSRRHLPCFRSAGTQSSATNILPGHSLRQGATPCTLGGSLASQQRNQVTGNPASKVRPLDTVPCSLQLRTVCHRQRETKCR